MLNAKHMMTRMFVLCMLVCSAADALVVTTGCHWNIQVHFVAELCLPEVQKIVLHLYHVLGSLTDDVIMFGLMHCDIFIFI